MRTTQCRGPASEPLPQGHVLTGCGVCPPSHHRHLFQGLFGYVVTWSPLLQPPMSFLYTKANVTMLSWSSFGYHFLHLSALAAAQTHPASQRLTTAAYFLVTFRENWRAGARGRSPANSTRTPPPSAEAKWPGPKSGGWRSSDHEELGNWGETDNCEQIIQSSTGVHENNVTWWGKYRVKYK